MENINGNTLTRQTYFRARHLTSDVIERIARYLLPDVLPVVMDIEKSSGCYIYDLKSKRPLLDCFSFIASNPIGFGDPRMDLPDFEDKLLRVAKLKMANSDLYTEEMAEFVETFARIVMPPGFNHLFFIEGGTLAVENALKTAFDWKVRLNLGRGLSEERGGQVLHFKEAFHGRSGYSLSLTNTDPRKTKYFPKFDWPRVRNPKIHFPLKEHLLEVEAAEQESLEQIEAAFRERPGEIAAIIIEPIQGEGGDNHFRSQFHQALRKIADHNEAMLIYDEVQTGIGLTGKMFAYQHYGITPDIIVFGKKTQVCGIIAGPRVDLVKNNVFVETSRINSTWGGNLTDMVRCQRYLEIIEEDDLVESVAFTGNLLLGELEKLEQRYPSFVSNARGKGLMCAIDLPDGEKRTAFIKKVIELGAVVLPCGQRSVRFRPSLTFSRQHVQELSYILESAIKATL